MLQKILCVIFSFCLLAVMLISALEAVVYGDRAMYRSQFEDMNASERVGMEIDDIVDVMDAMLDYMRGGRDDLVVVKTIFGEQREFFNDREKAHMVDVRVLMMGVLAVRNVLLFVSAALLAGIILTKGEWKRVLAKSILWCGAVLIAAGAAAALFFAIDFTSAWTMFHKIFFTNDLWLLNYNTDLLIRIMPESFFAAIIVRFAALFAAAFVLLMVLCGFRVRKEKLQCQKNALTAENS